MKKIFIFFFMIFSSFIYAQTLPQELQGIWENSDRIIFFEKENTNLTALLKEYYGWYYDRASEPQEYSEKENRPRNAATPRKAEQISLQINNTENPSVYEAQIDFSKYQKNIVPFVILENKIYLEFFQKIEISENEKSNNKYEGFYKGNLKSEGFNICEQSIPENITCYYIIDNKIYDIRYWLTDMEYTQDYVDFTYKDDRFFIPKHIQTGGKIYTCVNGRSKKVRNTMPPFEFNSSNYLFDKDNTFFVKNDKPYLYRILDKDDFDKLMQIVAKANNRRAPLPDPPFPPSNLDWHWDLIDELEKENELIQKVRERQRAFGPRPREFGM